MLINDENNPGIRVQSTLSLIIFDMRKLYMSLPTQNNKGTYVRIFFIFKNDSCKSNKDMRVVESNVYPGKLLHFL